MAYTYEQSSGDIIINGWEKGIFPSPHQGIGDIKCANISTLTGEVMANYARVKQTDDYTKSGVLTIGNGGSISYTGLAAGVYLKAGSWITVTNSSNAGNFPNQNYFIASSSQSSLAIQLSPTFGTGFTIYTQGITANWTFLVNTSDVGGVMTKPVQSATETYFDSSNVTQYRYYIMDDEGHVWVNDTANAGTNSIGWLQIDTVTARKAQYGSSQPTTLKATGFAVYNGWIFLFIGGTILTKLTSMLGVKTFDASTGWDAFTVALNSSPKTINPHFTYSSKAGILYWTDGAFIGSLFATAGVPNLWSYGTCTVDTVANKFTVQNQIGGTALRNGMPLTFKSSNGDANIPAPLNATTIYYVISASTSSASTTFQLSLGINGAAIVITTTGSGTIYFNTFDPRTSNTYILSTAACTIPQQQDIAQCITEIGSTILIGCASNALYFWDGVAITPNAFLFLPESNAVNIITVNNTAYIFCGSRGNIYITNGNTSSLIITVPNYISSGVVDPYFTWGGAMYSSGRVWFSIQDQNAAQTGNCGGVWSFVPTQNFFVGQDTGLALRLDHQNSYGTYNGMANVFISSQNQLAKGVQYYSAWTSSVSSPVYGIDFSGTTPYTGGQTTIETDLIPIGNFLDKQTFSQLVYRLAAPLVSGESIQILARSSITGTFVSLGTDSTVGLIGNSMNINFDLGQWIQLQIKLTSTATNPSFVRLTDIRLTR